MKLASSTNILLIVLIVAVIGVGIVIPKYGNVAQGNYPGYGDLKISSGLASNGEELKNLLDVNGDATVSADPDKVEIYLGTETTAVNAKDSQQENADIMQAIRSSLQSIGITTRDIKTTEYSLTAITHYDEKTEKYVITGYKTTHIIKIQSTDINKAGDIIDKSVQSGANRVNNVVFSLTDAKIKEMRLDTLKKAGTNAREKADAMADSLGVTIKRVYRASEGYVYYQPYYAAEKSYVNAGVSAPTEITPGQIEIRASVSVSYELV
jgi:hypothetical protein